MVEIFFSYFYDLHNFTFGFVRLSIKKLLFQWI